MQQLPIMFQFGFKKTIVLLAWLVFMKCDCQPIKEHRISVKQKNRAFVIWSVFLCRKLQTECETYGQRAPASRRHISAIDADDVIIYSSDVTEFANAI